MSKYKKSCLVSVVIVNYNTCDILRKCLLNLRKTYSTLQIIVVDNNSSDGSVEMVVKNFPDVEMISLNQNMGLATGNNVGLRKAKAEYVLFMGSDAFPQDDAIKTLAEYMERNKSVGISVGQVNLRSGLLDKDTHRGFPVPWVALTHFSGLESVFPRSRLFSKYYMGYENMSIVHEIDLCTTHFMFTRKSVFDDIGFWDEDFFVYGEDVDLCWRVKKNGWRIMYIPQAQIIHYKGVSVGVRKETQDITRATEEVKKKMLLETTKAMTKFYSKHFDNGTLRDWVVVKGIGLLSKLRALKVRFDYS
jgi:GT2 family glycosyltransferase